MLCLPRLISSHLLCILSMARPKKEIPASSQARPKRAAAVSTTFELGDHLTIYHLPQSCIKATVEAANDAPVSTLSVCIAPLTLRISGLCCGSAPHTADKEHPKQQAGCSVPFPISSRSAHHIRSLSTSSPSPSPSPSPQTNANANTE